MLSVVIAVLINLGFQTYWFFTIENQSAFYQPPHPVNPDSDKFKDTFKISYQDTVLFLASNYQYLFVCLAFSVSKPFRKSIFTNKLFLISVIVKTVFDTYLLFVGPDNWSWTFFKLQPIPLISNPVKYSYRFRFVFEIVLNCLLTVVFERFLVRKISEKFEQRMDAKKKQKFLKLMQDTIKQPDKAGTKSN